MPEHSPLLTFVRPGGAVPVGDPEAVLMELERRHAHLCVELATLEGRLRELRTAAEVCLLCGGAGERWVRGGMYGELQRRRCPCQEE